MEYAFPALSVLPLINWVVLPPAGLSGGAIYDMPQAYQAATNVYLEVNAVNTSVSCKAMTGVQQVGSPDSRGLYLFRLAPTIKDVYLALRRSYVLYVQADLSAMSFLSQHAVR